MGKTWMQTGVLFPNVTSNYISFPEQGVEVSRCPVDEALEQVELIVARDSHETYVGDFGFIAFDGLDAVPLLVVMESEVPEL